MAGALSSVVAKLTALLSDEYTKLKSVRRNITYLRDELSSMNALLITLASAETLDEQRKEWRNNVRELAYDMEDCIDVVMHKLAHGDADRSFIKKTARDIKNLWLRHKVASQIQELTDRVKEVSERRSRYKLDDSPALSATHVAIDPRLPVLLAESKNLIGVDGPREEITGWLMDGESQLKVVSIVGSAGLGKTTLAVEVYRSLGGHFHYKASTSVSRSLDLKKLIKDILGQLEPTSYGHGQLDSLELEQLIRELRGYLQDKRYLIVIDDIWRISDWDLVKSVLPENSHRSRVIATTRIASVAKSCCSNIQELIYEIKPLNATNSRRLFMRRIFHSEDYCPPQLEEVSKAILKKCGGLPLAIVTISSLLSTKPETKDQWERVKDGLGSAREEASIKMKKILLLSYYDLPYYLRACFLYLSIFPEDHVIPRRDLIWKWIAERLIDGEKGQTLEEVGETYFNELINRSLILPVGILYDGRAYACQVHDVLLDFMVLLSEEENFAAIFDGTEVGAKFLRSKIRRLSLQHNSTGNDVQQVSMQNLVHVRSVHAFCPCSDIIDQLDYPALRVLDIEGCCSCVQDIQKCSQLRYLNLTRTGITEVPKEIGHLEYLETLDLIGSLPKGKLTPAIGQLRRLKNLFVSVYIILPDEITNLRALQVLHMPNVKSVKLVKWLGGLNELRELYMGFIEPDGTDYLRSYKESFDSFLREQGRHKLRVLNLFPPHFDSTPVNPLMDSCCSFISSSPRPMSALAHLSYLDTWVHTMENRYFCALRELPCLLLLGIAADYALEERYVVSNKGIQSLKQFTFRVRRFGRIGLVFEPGAMPKLEMLVLFLRAEGTKCNHGVGADFGFEHLSALKHVKCHTSCAGATTAEVDSFEAAIRNAVSTHPNHSRIELAFSRGGEDKMLKDTKDQEGNAGQEEANFDQGAR